MSELSTQTAMPEPRETPIADTTPWYVLQTRPRRELLVAGQLERHTGLAIFLPEVLQPSARGTGLVPLFPGYLFVQVDLQQRPAGLVIHTPGVIRLVGHGQQPTPVAAEVVQRLQERVHQVNAKGGLPHHSFQPGDPVTFTTGPLHGLDAVFVGPQTPSQRVQVLLYFLGQQQQMEVDVQLLEKTNGPRPQASPARPPRRTRGKGRRIRTASVG